MATANKKFKPPKTLGACADMLYELKAKRATAQKIVDAYEADEKALKEHIINTLPKSETTGVAGKVARVSVVTKDVAQVKDWDAFWKAFNKAKDIDLLPRSISKAAVDARLEAGKKVAGVELVKVVSVSLNKLK